MPKKNCPNKCSKICSTPDIVFHALPSGIASSYVTVRKEESQQNTFSQVGNETGKFPEFFFLVLGGGRKRTHVVGKWVIERVSKQTGGIRCIKPQYSEGTYFMDGHS